MNADREATAFVEQVAKLGPVSRAAGMDCECPLYTELIFTDKEKSVKAKKTWSVIGPERAQSQSRVFFALTANIKLNRI